MSLRHAILGVLSAEPMTGYELVSFIDDSVGYVWSATQSQTYPELRDMEAAGLIQASVVPRGRRAEKRVYAITDVGRAELKGWVEQDLPYPPLRDAHKLQALFYDLASFDSARAHLDAHAAYWTRKLGLWQERAASLRSRRFPLVRKRLERRDPAEHESIVAFKAWTFDGALARAQAEIAWAHDGMRLIDGLEKRRLQGSEQTSPPACGRAQLARR